VAQSVKSPTLGFWLRSWSQSREIQPLVRLRAQRGVCLRFSPSATSQVGKGAHAFSQTNKPLEIRKGHFLLPPPPRAQQAHHTHQQVNGMFGEPWLTQYRFLKHPKIKYLYLELKKPKNNFGSLMNLKSNFPLSWDVLFKGLYFHAAILLWYR